MAKTMPPPDSKSIFVSYRRKDSSTSSRWLAESLRLAFGSEAVFIDTDSIREGDNWRERINRALESSTVLVPVIGPQWLRLQDEYGSRRLDKPDDWVRSEIRHALSGGKRIIPVLVQEAELPRRAALPPDMADLENQQALKIRDDEWEHGRAKRMRALEDCGFRKSREDIQYPPPFVRPKELSRPEIEEALKRLVEWKVVTRPYPQAKTGEAVELHKQFVFDSFEDAMHFMMTATRHISRAEHHPDWRNTWRTVSVWLTTWDIDHKPSVMDLELAEHLDELYLEYKARTT